MGYTPPQSSGEHYLSLQEAVTDGYGAYSTLRSWIAKGTLPAVKIGGRVKVLRADLDALAVPKQPRPETREAAIARVLADAPTPNADQRRRLASILGGAS